jgi:hypothetical protein
VKLWTNQSGSWRLVVEFDATRVEAVKQAAALLGGVTRVKMRIAIEREGNSPQVVAVFNPPKFHWESR